VSKLAHNHHYFKGKTLETNLVNASSEYLHRLLQTQLH